MNHSQRRAEKKRRREKRLSKKERIKGGVDQLIYNLRQLTSITEPAAWPGAVDPVLGRPDRIKLEYATFAERGPGRDQFRQMQRRLQQGLMHFVPNIDHWGMEEFFWHGLPGNPTHPLDQFLQCQRDRFSPAARTQLARWKEAQIGCYEIGTLADDLVSLREVCVPSGRPVGPWVRAIALSLGGVNAYGPHQGKVNLTYLAPWAPDENIFCAMGFGQFHDAKQIAATALLIRGLRSIEAVTFPLPWRMGQNVLRQCYEQWRERDWFLHMKTKVRCPFEAVFLAPKGPEFGTVHQLLTESTLESQYAGLYFEVDDRQASGATAIYPIDFESPNAMAFAEYRQFRSIAGPPPASRDRV